MRDERIVTGISANLSQQVGTKAGPIMQAVRTYVGLMELLSNPPSGCYQITNMYMYKEEGEFKITIIYKDDPEP